MTMNIAKLRAALQAKADEYADTAKSAKLTQPELFITFSTASLVLFALVVALYEVDE